MVLGWSWACAGRTASAHTAADASSLRNVNKRTLPGFYFGATIGSGRGSRKRGGAGLEGVGHLEHDLFKGVFGHAVQQPALEFELNRKLHFAAVTFGGEAPVVLQGLERAFCLHDIDTMLRRGQ